MMKRKMALVLCCMIAMASVTGCSEEPDIVMDTSVYVETTTPEQGNLSIQNDFIGTISPQEQVAVVPMVSGEITELHFDVGDEVKAGQVMFRIDDSAARLQLESAELSLANIEQSEQTALGTSQKLNNLQIESSIDSIKTQIDTYQKQFEDADRAQGKTEAQLGGFEAGIKEVEEQISGLNQKYELAKKYIGSVSKNAAGGYEFIDPSGAAASEVAAAGMSAKDVSPEGLAATASSISALKSQITQLRANMASAEATVENFKSTKGTLANSADAARKNLETTTESYNLQNTEVPENTAKTYEVQKGTAAVGIDSAKLQLSYYTVTAPISGVIESKNIDEYSIAQTGSPAYIITNKNSMTVTFAVSEDVKNTMVIGQGIQLDRNGKLFTANITEIGTAVDPQTGLFTIKGTVEATGEELPGGVTVKIAADTYHVENALLIPYDAVYYDNDQAYVYCVENGKAKQVFVETGIFDETTIVILSGLTGTSQVITNWSPQLTDGVTVRTQNEEAVSSNEAENLTEETE